MAAVLLVIAAPLVLFAEPLATYRLHSDDFAYIGASRTLTRTIANLFVPHNTHIVPSWRLLTWAVVSSAGRLANLQTTLAAVSFATLALTMLLLRRFVTRDTGSPVAGLAAAVVFGTTSVMKSAATWYSAGQTLWAALGILLTLTFLQGWRRSGGVWRPAGSALSAWFAGGMWTIGHAAGPVGAVYLFADGRSRCRKAAAIPLAATLITMLTALALGGRRINAKISFHGRTSKQAVDVFNGAGHTLQSVPEDLGLQNLGLEAPTTLEQGIILTALLLICWFRARVRTRRAGPMEWAGLTLVFAAYFVEWSFRGYLPFSSLRGVVPWYDTIPQLGAVLFLSGWLADARPPLPARIGRLRDAPLGAVLAVLALTTALLAVHRPRVQSLYTGDAPKPTPAEARVFLTPELRLLRARYLASALARHQRLHLARLDAAEAVARREGIGRKGIADAFGRVDTPEIPDVYDAADMLALPWENTDPSRTPADIRRVLGPYLRIDPTPTIPLDRLP